MCNEFVFRKPSFEMLMVINCPKNKLNKEISKAIVIIGCFDEDKHCNKLDQNNTQI